MSRSIILLLASLLLPLAGCSEQEQAVASAGTVANDVRWYDQARVERGERIYADNCASCHGVSAQGATAWRQRDAAGRLPPPPLNGTGHAWHHPFQVLASQIKFGAPGGQGSMPALGDRLADEDIIDVIAWFQHHWNDEIYADWTQREQQFQAARKP